MVGLNFTHRRMHYPRWAYALLVGFIALCSPSSFSQSLDHHFGQHHHEVHLDHSEPDLHDAGHHSCCSEAPPIRITIHSSSDSLKKQHQSVSLKLGFKTQIRTQNNLFRPSNGKYHHSPEPGAIRRGTVLII